MAKLTESYLRKLIKQSLNEMGGMSQDPVDQGHNALRRAFDFLNDALLSADPETKQSIDSALNELNTLQEILSDLDEDYMMRESRKRKLGESRDFGPPGSPKPKQRVENTSLVYKRAKKKIESDLKLSPAEKKAVIELLNEYIEDYSGGPDYGI